jgi:Fe-S oxidoreductase/nitrate reductase gamma subunit
MGRVPYWNIQYGIMIDLMAIPVLCMLGVGFYRYWTRIQAGKDRLPTGLRSAALKIGPLYIRSFLTRGLLGTRIYDKLLIGITHGCLFWGMGFLFAGTTLVILNILFGLPIFEGRFNQWFMSFGLDTAGLAALIGVFGLFINRLSASKRLVAVKPRKGFIPMELAIMAILVSGFFLEGLRIAGTTHESGAWVGNTVAVMVSAFPDALVWHQIFWWAHGLAALAFIAWIPFSPLAHLVLAPLNTGLSVPIAGPKMGVLDFSMFENEDSSEEPRLGVSKLADFSKKRLLDASACLWCGRCHEVCPAAATNKPLSPKAVLVAMSEHLDQEKYEEASLIDDISRDAIFNCTTCAACMEVCPVSINQPKAIMRLRQHLVMEQSEMPEIMSQALKSLEARQHPFFGAASGKKDWRKGLNVPIFEKGHTEYLLWIGCAATYEERAQKIARAMVSILERAGVSYGILEEARCTGDPAKQMGNEFLFQEIAQQNIGDFMSMGIKKIITLCPHCFNSFTRHYAPLGGFYTVIPHAVMIDTLIQSGKIKLRHQAQSITYHDPCYLGRRNTIFNEPRQALSSIGNLVEMANSRRLSFCCGAGGGNYWSEEEGARINQVRAREALDTTAGQIATSCPFCLLMLTDGVKKFTEEQKVFDIAELVSAAIDE